MNTSEMLYISVGGRPVPHGVMGVSEILWNFGWVPPDFRSDEENLIHEANLAEMPDARVLGNANEDADYADLTKLWSRSEVSNALGFPYTGTHQLTGSCVGAGMGNATASLNFFEVLVLGDNEKIFLPFYPYAYGRGRLHSGMRGRGEGSTGSGQAKAVKEDGVMDNSIAGLPKPTSTSDGIVWGNSVEMEWSAGDKVPEKYLTEGKKHTITDVAKLSSSDDVRKSIVNGKPVTCASMYAFKASVVGEGKEACLLGRKQGSWSHQMSMHAYWKHPKHGPLFWLMNQWGLNAHGTCPTGMPRGGAWITGSDVDGICRSEVFAYAGHSGWVTPNIDWDRI